MNQYIVFDTKTNAPLDDGHGHIRVYSNRTAAKRRAQTMNRSVAPIPGEPKFKRWAICACRVSLDVQWGKPNYEDA